MLPELVCFHVPVRSAGCSTGFFSAGFFVVCDWLVLLGVGGKALPAGTLGCFAGILALASTKWEDGE